MRLRHKDKFQVTWRAINHAGLSSSALSQVVIVDAIPPVISYAADMAVGAGEVDFVAATDLEYTMLFEASDPDSAVVSSAWCLGTFPGACDKTDKVYFDHRLRQVTGRLSGLTDRILYFPTLFVYNGAGSGTALSTDGFEVDASPPVCGAVYDGLNIDVAWVGSTTLTPSWAGITDLGSYAAWARTGDLAVNSRTTLLAPLCLFTARSSPGARCFPGAWPKRR